MKTLSAVIGLCLLPLFAIHCDCRAQATMVKDINTTVLTPHNSVPRNMIVINGTLFFPLSFDDIDSEQQGGFSGGPAPLDSALWKSDGTIGGTSMVRDVAATNLVNFNGTLFFAGTDVGHGSELWKSDGTFFGTVLVKDINPGGAGSFPQNLTVAGGLLFFNADDGVHGPELWVSDGTSDGTVLVKDINAGSTGSAPGNFASANGLAFFSANDGANGTELWMSDGTAAGTVMVKDINPGSTGSNPQNLTAVNNKVFFSADDGVHGRELWVSDGTLAGTSLVADLAVSGSSNPSNLTNFNGTLYFSTINTSQAMWTSDGTTLGTVPLSINAPSPINSPRSFAVVGNTMYFITPWLSGPDRLCSVNAGSTVANVVADNLGNPVSPFPEQYLTNVNGALYFSYNDGTHHRQLWTSDGTTVGTRMVQQINLTGDALYTTTTMFFNPYFVGLNGNVLFMAKQDSTGYGLWTTDGSSNGAIQILGVNSGANGSYTGNPPIDIGGKILLDANDGVHGNELWISDGTSPGTLMVKDILPGSVGAGPTKFTNLNGITYFLADDGTGQALWRSDGTGPGTMPVLDQSSSRILLSGFTATGNAFYYSFHTGFNQFTLYKFDPLSSTTTALAVLPHFPNGGILDVNGTVFFTVSDVTTGVTLWTSDGTAGGTTEITTVTASFTGVEATVALDGQYYFTLQGGSFLTTQLWKSDGTAAGTVMLKDIYPPPISHSTNLTVGNHMLFFTGNDGTHGEELWVSDGTSAGTGMIKDINTGAASSSPTLLTNVNGTLFFLANDGVHGAELWKSDGTNAGTMMVKDILPGPVGASYGFSMLALPGGRVLFGTSDGEHGNELWVSDGTPNGTVMVQDINPGPYSSNPALFTLSGSNVFFFAMEPVHGFELWVMPLSDLSNLPPAAADQNYSMSFNAVLTVSAPGVLSTAYDKENDPLTAQLVTGPTHGLLTLNADGSFVYTPNNGFQGLDGFVFQANDGSRNSGTANVTITVLGALAITTPSPLPDGIIGQAYSFSLGAMSGTPPYTWSLIGGPLPAGLALAADGSVTGTPTATGIASFTAQVADSVSVTASKAFSLTIDSLPSVTTISSLPNPSTFGQSITVNVTVSGSGSTPTGTITFFDGLINLGTQPLVTGKAGISLSSLSVATHSLKAQYGGDATYAGSFASLSQTVDQATPVITWNNATDIVFGTALDATQLNATAGIPGVFVYSPNSGTVLNAGNNQTLSVTFTPTDTTDYTTATKNVSINVLKATPVITWANPADITFGTALSATQLDATAGISGVFVYSPSAGTMLSAGNNQTLSVTFTPTDTTDYTTASKNVSINVLKTTPAITWTNPVDIAFGTALGATQLDATAGIPGVFVYSPNTGTVLSVGNNQTLSVAFTPTDTTDYTTASKNVSINVIKAAPVITWRNPADIKFGTALSVTQLNATANVPGTFVYAPPSGTLLNIGNDQTLSVTFTPTDTNDYTGVGKNVFINVLNSAPVILSAPSAMPNPAATGQSVTFSVAASDVDGDALTYIWDFGDGTSGTGVTAMHTYTSPANFTVTVTVSDSAGAMVTAGVNVQIIAALIALPGSVGTLIDSNGDGIPDEMQAAANVLNISSLPAPLPLSGVKLSIKLNFAKSESDVISLSGVLPVAATPTVTPVIVDVGGVVKTFALSSSGKAKSGADSLTVVFSRSKSGKTPSAKFNVKLTRGTFAGTLATLGLANADVNAAAVNVPVAIIFDAKLWAVMQAQTYTAKKGKSGTSKNRQ